MPNIAGRIISIREQSELRLDEDPNRQPTEMQRSNIKSIFFDVDKASDKQRRENGRLLNYDLRLRRLDLGGSIGTCQDRLKTQHKAEYTFMKASKSLDDMNNSQKVAAMVMMMDSVPCILHMENRVGLKFLTLVLKKGLTNAKGDGTGSLLPYIGTNIRSENKRIETFLAHIARVMNTKVLGSNDNPTQWQVPYDVTTKTIAVICIDNERIRKVITNFEELVRSCVSDPTEMQERIACVSSYR
ncbi:hypothetical protein ACA910_015372 [Epithemia clementina (nom. ined.)]